MVQLEHLVDRGLGGLPGVQARVRVLEDDLHLAAAAAPLPGGAGRGRPVPAAGGDRSPAVGRSRPTIIRAIVVLPEPDSPTIASDLACRHGEADVVDGDQVAELLAQVADLEHGLAVARVRRLDLLGEAQTSP